ncbi:hypothetical protein WAI453_002422 [Rhynchosporium graminicola]
MNPKSSLQSLIESAFPQNDGNSTSDSAVGFSPTTILETFVPGYGPIHKFLLVSFGLDVTVLVSLGVALYIGAKIFHSVRSAFYSIVATYYMSDVTVSNEDDIHTHVLQFLAHKYETVSSRHLKAETSRRSAWQFDNEEAEKEENAIDANGQRKWLNFSNQAAKTKPLFTPAMGFHEFWHNGTYFLLRRKEVPVFSEGGGGNGTAIKDKESLTLTCYGRSTEPIKNLLHDAKVHYHVGHNAKTIIKRPSPKDMRRYGGPRWREVAERPCRPMETVVLDEQRKLDVMDDINEYLKPSTARWHANRGIPYRRGYLFYGPPGTGKTSLTFALAGKFGLNIHVVSLLDSTLTEEELGMLFTNLPPRCIVLLEDIDTAGLIRAPTEDETKSSGENADENELNVANLAKALAKNNRLSDEEKKKGISLSGLLNIIDGVASHEGRVLVMTTNAPEKLDEALIRPGRVDYQVAFGSATQTQIKELFERMYTDDHPRAKAVISPLPTITTTPTARVHEPDHITTKQSVPTPPPTPITSQPHLEGNAATASQLLDSRSQNENEKLKEEKEPISSSELSSIATAFARKIPNQQFSPAEIQGYLLKRKSDPRRALREISAWVEDLVEQKKKGRSWKVETEEGDI